MHNLTNMRVRMLPVVVIVLVTAHGIVLYRVSSHAALGMAAASGVIVLVLIKHLGLLGSFTMFRRRPRGRKVES